jgi:hypothetical protein
MNDIAIVRDFLAESYENPDRLDQDFVGLGKNPKDKETLAGVLRTIHTIKGPSVSARHLRRPTPRTRDIEEIRTNSICRRFWMRTGRDPQLSRSGLADFLFIVASHQDLRRLILHTTSTLHSRNRLIACGSESFSRLIGRQSS